MLILFLLLIIRHTKGAEHGDTDGIQTDLQALRVDVGAAHCGGQTEVLPRVQVAPMG